MHDEIEVESNKFTPNPQQIETMKFEQLESGEDSTLTGFRDKLPYTAIPSIAADRTVVSPGGAGLTNGEDERVHEVERGDDDDG